MSKWIELLLGWRCFCFFSHGRSAVLVASYQWLLVVSYDQILEVEYKQQFVREGRGANQLYMHIKTICYGSLIGLSCCLCKNIDLMLLKKNRGCVARNRHKWKRWDVLWLKYIYLFTSFRPPVCRLHTSHTLTLDTSLSQFINPCKYTRWRLQDWWPKARKQINIF